MYLDIKYIKLKGRVYYMRSKFLLASLLAATLVFTACGNTTTTTTEPATTETTTSEEGVVSEVKEEVSDKVEDIKDTDDGKDVADAARILDSELKNKDLEDLFKAEYANGVVTEIKYDTENGRHEFKVEGIENGAELEVKVDPFTGDIISAEKDEDDDNYDTGLDFALIKEWKEVLQVAIDEVGNKDIDEFDLAYDDGVYKMEVEFKNGTDVKVNAETLEIIEVDR